MAAAMHAAIDHIDGGLGLWPVFDLVAETLSVREIVEVIKMLFGVEIGMEHQNVSGDQHMAALGCNKSDSSRAKIVLGWNSRRTQFLLNLPVYLRAWRVTTEYQNKHHPART